VAPFAEQRYNNTRRTDRAISRKPGSLKGLIAKLWSRIILFEPSVMSTMIGRPTAGGRRFQMIMLPEKDQLACVRLINSLTSLRHCNLCKAR